MDEADVIRAGGEQKLRVPVDRGVKAAGVGVNEQHAAVGLRRDEGRRAHMEGAEGLFQTATPGAKRTRVFSSPGAAKREKRAPPVSSSSRSGPAVSAARPRQGVSWYSRAFPIQRWPVPQSVARKPKRPLVRRFCQARGGREWFT